MATIKDVAKLAGVSVATVSRVVNKSPKASESSKKLVTDAMLELGYRPNANARALVSQTSDTIGLMVSDVSDPFFGSLAKAVERVARDQGMHLLIGNGFHQTEQEREVLDLLISKRCQAFVVHSKALSDEELLEYARREPGMVLMNRMIPEIAHRCITLDNAKGTEVATRYLLGKGHRHFAFINSTHDITDQIERLSGCERTLREAGLNIPQAAIACDDPNEEGGERAALNLLSRGIEFTAVVAYNDAMAFGAMSALADNGIRVPDDVSIVGFDNLIYGKYLRPKLTTIRYPIELMATSAIILALELSKLKPGLAEKPQLNFIPTLVIRQSVVEAHKQPAIIA
ncbi:LacI family DNA-binding transcriptional regulator [Alginatibacterium sediminis]|uniref:LacI family DNA-binding transcriptional regulator n=1 Tax=Alginatibacterium sediminis TaxID=2164068 RepID=A0A420E7M1_9ALTE|nr:substrate-binding domain-containing protein [Alginatibacterium sediminis]RKF14448.1 LacI family DNA-binding transcriptional regulator [Alginatibacterium sediminis]